MIVLLITIIVVLALCGIYGPKHDKFKEEMKKQEEEFEETMQMTDETIRMVEQSTRDLQEISRRMDQELAEALKRARESGINTEKLLNELEES